jgi:hypothetical protein
VKGEAFNAAWQPDATQPPRGVGVDGFCGEAGLESCAAALPLVNKIITMKKPS